VALKAPLVLLAEDDEAGRSALAELLRVRGFEVVAAVDGQDAHERLSTGLSPCVILLDWVMPRMGGAEFLKARAATTSQADVPVVVMSATHAPVDAPGQVHFLPKPFGLPALERAVRGVCLRCPEARRKARGCG
jgi:CheY-like chemotaxis protein